MIGAGAYGTIYRVKDSERNLIEKHMNVISCGTFTEIAFFKKYCMDKKTSLFPILNKIWYEKRGENVFVVISMSDEGKTLDTVAKELSYSERISHLPEMIVQFGQILQWLKSKNLIHMDIKPNNICWGNNPKRPQLKLIDFGFAIPVLDIVRQSIGTHNFADPSYFVERVHSISYDTFSAGLTLFYWLIKIFVTQSIIVK